MRSFYLTAFILLFLMGHLAASATEYSAREAPQLPPPPDLQIDPLDLPESIEDIEDVQRCLYKDGRVYIAGQPSEGALQTFEELGVTVVVNLCTLREMEDRQRISFDEEAAVARLGMQYVHIPLGGDEHPCTPEALDRFAEVHGSRPVALQRRLAGELPVGGLSYPVSGFYVG